MHDFTPIPALIGGALIGLSASSLLLLHGRIAGISGIFGGILRRTVSDRPLRLWFIAGLLVAGLAARVVYPSAFASTWMPSLPLALGAGILVGFGTQLGNGCTSGHGVCGISRMSVRSLLATATFMVTGLVTVFFVRHVIGV